MSDDEFFDMNRIVVTTYGSKGSEVCVGKQQTKVEVAKIKEVIDPTGAGDAYRAGFIAGYARGFELKTCAQMASVSAVYAVENYGTQNQAYTMEEFSKRYQENYGEELNITY